MKVLKPAAYSNLMSYFIGAWVLSFCIESFAAERKVVETIPVNSDVAFSINTNRSAVRISTSNNNIVEISATISHESEEVTKDVEIRINKSRGRVAVDKVYYKEPLLADIGSWFKLNDWQIPEVKYDIVLPDTASLTIDGNRADLYIEAPAGRVEISSYDGESIITGIRNDLNLDTYKGQISIAIQQLNDVDIDSFRGEVNVSIENADDFTLEAESRNGSIDVEGIDVITREEGGLTYMNRRIGNGSNLIDVNGGRGNVEIRFQD